MGFLHSFCTSECLFVLKSRTDGHTWNANRHGLPLHGVYRLGEEDMKHSHQISENTLC